MSENTRNFYRDLSPLDDFDSVTDVQRHTDVPADWYVVVADVVGSTQEISLGRYKQVNMIGGACIAAVINVDRSIEIPFVFGGDGATFAIPPFLKDKVSQALASAIRMARESFAIQLRVGVVPIASMQSSYQWFRMAKLRMSPHVFQAAFSGRGWAEAERLIKADNSEFRIEEGLSLENADFTGLECRWKGIPAILDCKVALIIVCTDQNSERHSDFYRRILNSIREVFGNDQDSHPIQESLLSLSPTWKVIGNEVRVRAANVGIFFKAIYYFKTALLCLLGNFLIKRKLDTGGYHWGSYLKDFVNNSDYRKFDGMLRMVLDGSYSQRDRIQVLLEELYQKGELVYGMHSSPEAIVTCLVSSYNGYHTHFVDGSDGGYATASVQLKERIKQRFQNAA